MEAAQMELHFALREVKRWMEGWKEIRCVASGEWQWRGGISNIYGTSLSIIFLLQEVTPIWPWFQSRKAIWFSGLSTGRYEFMVFV